MVFVGPFADHEDKTMRDVRGVFLTENAAIACAEMCLPRDTTMKAQVHRLRLGEFYECGINGRTTHLMLWWDAAKSDWHIQRRVSQSTPRPTKNKRKKSV